MYIANNVYHRFGSTLLADCKITTGEIFIVSIYITAMNLYDYRHTETDYEELEELRVSIKNLNYSNDTTTR